MTRGSAAFESGRLFDSGRWQLRTDTTLLDGWRQLGSVLACAGASLMC